MRTRKSNTPICTWVVGDKSDGCPAKIGDEHGVLPRRVHQVELALIPGRVVDADALRQQEHVVAVQVHRVRVPLQHRRALEHHVHRRAVPEPPRHHRPRRRLQPHLLRPERRQRLVRVVVRPRRPLGELLLLLAGAGVEAVVVVRLQDRRRRRGGDVERDVVHVRHHDGLLQVAPSLAGRAAVAADGAEAERDEQALVGARRDTPPTVAVEARAGRQVAAEVERSHRVVLVRHLRHGSGGRVPAVAAVLQRASGGVLRRLRVGRRRLDGLGGDVVPAGRGRVGDDNGVERLAGRDDDDVGAVGSEVVGVGGDHREPVAGDLEEVLREERRVDYSQQVRLARFYVQHVPIFQHAFNITLFSTTQCANIE